MPVHLLQHGRGCVNDGIGEAQGSRCYWVGESARVAGEALYGCSNAQGR